MYTIKQVSQLTGISGYTLRFYDNEGLFPNLRRDGCGRRIFSDGDLHDVKTIQTLRGMGFPIERIRAFIEAGREGAQSARRRGEIVAEQMVQARRELAELTRRIELLERAADYYERESGADAGRAAAGATAA